MVSEIRSAGHPNSFGIIFEKKKGAISSILSFKMNKQAQRSVWVGDWFEGTHDANSVCLKSQNLGLLMVCLGQIEICFLHFNDFPKSRVNSMLSVG